MEPPKDAVVTLACQLPIGNVNYGITRVTTTYCTGKRGPVEPPGNTAMILGATKIYCTETRAQLELPLDTVMTPGHHCSQHEIR